MSQRREHGMSVIVKTVTRLTLGFILLYGVYIALNGHIATGGGFAGGVIVAISLVHIMLAFGKEVALKRLHAHVLRVAISLAALVFLAAAGAGLLGVRTLWRGQIAVPLAQMLVVGGGLFAIFVALVLLSKTDKDAE